MKTTIKVLGLIFITFIAFSCDISENEDVDPALSFVKIYDSQQFDLSLEAIDVQPTADGGFLVLGGFRRDDTDFLGVYLMKADSVGNFVSDTFFPTDQVHPIGDFLVLGGQYYFLSMNSVSLEVNLNQVDQEGNLVQSTGLGLTYPLHVKQDGDNQFILLSYDNQDKNTVISTVNSQGAVVDQSEFGIGAGQDVEQPIIEHFTRTGRQLPFFVGRTNEGQYYLNGFYNFTLSLLFTNLNGNDPTGVVQGQQDNGGISNVLPLAGDQFAIARFNFGDNYVNAQTNLDMGSITSSTDIEGNPMIEWVENAQVMLLETNINNAQYIIYASTTNGQQIVLQFYERGSGNFISSDYLGFSNPYQFGSIKETEDGGIVVLGRTQVAGRFNRLCLFKLSAQDLKENVR